MRSAEDNIDTSYDDTNYYPFDWNGFITLLGVPNTELVLIVKRAIDRLDTL